MAGSALALEAVEGGTIGRRGGLIASGPFALVKHPIYTAPPMAPFG